jgi:hypothetical protein
MCKCRRDWPINVFVKSEIRVNFLVALHTKHVTTDVRSGTALILEVVPSEQVQHHTDQKENATILLLHQTIHLKLKYMNSLSTTQEINFLGGWWTHTDLMHCFLLCPKIHACAKRIDTW